MWPGLPEAQGRYLQVIQWITRLGEGDVQEPRKLEHNVLQDMGFGHALFDQDGHLPAICLRVNDLIRGYYS